MSKGSGLTLSRAYLQSKRERIQFKDHENKEKEDYEQMKSDLKSIKSVHRERIHQNDDRLSNRILHKHFRFPGVALPNVAPQTAKQKRSPTKVLSAVLSRRNIAMMSDVKSKTPTDVDNSHKVKKATGTELTCLQLANTLMSYHRSPYSGFYGRNPIRARHMDVTNESEPRPFVKDNTFLIDTNKKQSDQRVPTPSYQTFQSERQRLAKSPSSTVSAGNESDISMASQPLPRKSILKNVTKTSRPSSEKMYGCSYQLPGATVRMRPHSETRPSSVFSSKSNNLRTSGLFGLREISAKYDFTDSVRSVPVKLEKQSTFTINSGSFNTTRKRMVRFNGANEIHEYTPRGRPAIDTNQTFKNESSV
ncbi:hypothetical protein ACF0H5_008364 [Mactra antiquata]